VLTLLLLESDVDGKSGVMPLSTLTRLLSLPQDLVIPACDELATYRLISYQIQEEEILYTLFPEKEQQKVEGT
jgi:hypothetical protein